MRLLVIGAKGMLGSEVVEAVQRFGLSGSGDLTALDLPTFDLTDAADVSQTVAELRPEVIVNCAAYTAVDSAETQRARAFAVNAEGAGRLARAAAAAGARIVHLSTDFIFDGTKQVPYVEEDPPNPLSVYAESKLAGEEAVRTAAPDHLIVRTSWLFGRHGRNFVSLILQKARQGGGLRVVSDQTGCPTYARDLAEALLAAVRAGLTGTYHLTNAEATTWFDLAQTAVRMAGLEVEVRPIAARDWPRAARVPAYSVLSCEKIRRAAGIVMRPWREALADFLQGEIPGPTS